MGTSTYDYLTSLLLINEADAVEKFESEQISQDMETFLVAVRTNNRAMLLMISKWSSDTNETKNYFARMAKRELEREGI
jgi:hypothetical protein